MHAVKIVANLFSHAAARTVRTFVSTTFFIDSEVDAGVVERDPLKRFKKLVHKINNSIDEFGFDLTNVPLTENELERIKLQTPDALFSEEQLHRIEIMARTKNPFSEMKKLDFELSCD